MIFTFRSTLVSFAGSTTLRTASTANGANNDDCWDTTLEFKAVEALLTKLSRSVSCIGVAIFLIISIDLVAAFWNPSEIAVGCIPFCKSFSETSNNAPATTTTLVVPSPASTSWAFDSSTS